MRCHETELLYSQEHHYLSKEVDYRMKKESLPDIHLTQDEYQEYEKNLKKISTSRKQTTQFKN